MPMSKSLASPTSHTVGSTGTSERKPVSLDRHDAVLAEKSRVCRVVKMRTGDRYSDSDLAEMMHSAREHVVRWRSSDDARAPTLTHLLLASDEVCDAFVAALAAARVRLGHSTRRWSAVDEERVADRTPALEQALAKATAANAELAELVATMRGSRGGR